MFRLSFALAAIAVLTLINFYSYKRFLKRLDLFFKYQSILKGVMILITLCEIFYFLVLRLDNLDPLLYSLFSAMLGVSFMLFCVSIIYDLFHIPYAKIPYDYSRRMFVKMVFDVTMLILALSYMTKGFINGMKAPMIKEVDVPISGLKEELCVVQITDVHIGKTLGKAFIDDIVKQINTLKADIVVITGDLVYRDNLDRFCRAPGRSVVAGGVQESPGPVVPTRRKSPSARFWLYRLLALRESC